LKFLRGQIVFEQSTPATMVYFVMKGCVKIKREVERKKTISRDDGRFHMRSEL